MAARATASANRFVPIASRAMRAAGTTTAQGFVSKPDPVLTDHVSPARSGRLLPEAEEGEAGDDDDRVGEPQPELDHERADEVRQDLPCDDAGRLDSLQFHGLYVVALGDVERGRTHDAGHLGHVSETDGEHDEPELGTDGPDDEQG